MGGDDSALEASMSDNRPGIKFAHERRPDDRGFNVHDLGQVC